MSLFEARDISVRFGGVKAVNGVSLDLEPGVITGLIGPNGAGKTTFIDAITGYVRALGRISIDDRPLQGLPPHQRARAGLGRTWQNAELFDELSVIDNVRLVTERLSARYFLRNLFWHRLEPAPERVSGVLGRLGIESFSHLAPAELSSGQRKLVGLARALASDAKVILMDEPAAGLDDEETAALRDQLLDVARRGTAILLVEHDMELVLSTCEVLYVMEMGSLIAAGRADEVRNDPKVIQAYLGTTRGGDGTPSLGGHDLSPSMVADRHHA